MLDDEMKEAIWAALQSEDPDTLFERFEKIVLDIQLNAIDLAGFKIRTLFAAEQFKNDIKPRLAAMVEVTLEETKDGFKGQP